MSTPDRLLVDVALEPSGDEQYRLRLRIEYRGDVPVSVYRASLPWATVQSLLLVAVKLDALGTVIEQVFPIDDPGVDRITLHPEQVLEGDIPLQVRFPGLAAAHREWDVMIYWTYQLKTVDGMAFERVSGSVFLPKR